MTFKEYTSKVWKTLPFGNDGRGTPIKLFVVHWALLICAIVAVERLFAYGIL